MRCFLPMLTGGIHTIACTEPVHALKHSLRLPVGDVIKVKRHKAAPGHTGSLAATSIQRAAYEAANVLEFILTCFFSYQGIP